MFAAISTLPHTTLCAGPGHFRSYPESRQSLAPQQASGHNRTLFGIGGRLAISAPKIGLTSEDQHKNLPAML